MTDAIWKCTSAEYHADRLHVSNSALSVFRQSRPLYAARYVHGTLPFPEPTPAMALGSAFHACILEPETFEKLYAIAPDLDRRTKAGKEEWAAFTELSQNRTVLTVEQFTLVKRIEAGIRENGFARDLIDAPGRSELAVRWTHDGLALKARFDRLLDARIIIDLKTASDPSPEVFARSASQHGYHRQAWLYQLAAMEALGLERPTFFHIACGTVEPFECHVYELDADALRLGEVQVTLDLARLRDCRTSGNWSSPLNGQANTLSLPKWAFTEPA